MDNNDFVSTFETSFTYTVDEIILWQKETHKEKFSAQTILEMSRFGDVCLSLVVKEKLGKWLKRKKKRNSRDISSKDCLERLT